MAVGARALPANAGVCYGGMRPTRDRSRELVGNPGLEEGAR